MKKTFLFSVDLEDVRERTPLDGRYSESVRPNTRKYLDWLSQTNSRCTFFIVGRVAEEFPDLIEEIIGRGHETACHSYDHTNLTHMSEDEFKRDLEKNVNALRKSGATEIRGFRAPTFSLVPSTRWTYRVLKEFGFQYSSSVLPAKNPLFGWSDFGGEQLIDGIYEIPMNIGSFPCRVPFGGGVYFRCLPLPVLKRLFKNEQRPVLGYFHPHDVATDQEHFVHSGLHKNRVANRLLSEMMYFNRSRVFKKLDAVLANDYVIIPYAEYYEQRTGAPKPASSEQRTQLTPI
jgi:polysaccharide deacetylase family protein (PEP-CTERM system associated)